MNINQLFRPGETVRVERAVAEIDAMLALGVTVESDLHVVELDVKRGPGAHGEWADYGGDPAELSRPWNGGRGAIGRVNRSHDTGYYAVERNARVTTVIADGVKLVLTAEIEP